MSRSLSGSDPVEWPADRPWTSDAERRCELRRHALQVSAVRRIASIADAESVSPATVAAALVEAWVSRITLRDDPTILRSLRQRLADDEATPTPSLALRIDIDAAPLVELPEGLDLGLDLRLAGTDPEMVLAYPPARFDAATAAAVAQSLATFVDHATASPDAPLASLELADDATRRQMLDVWSDATTDYPRDRHLAELFDRQAATSGDRVVIVEGKRSITWSELDRRSAQLANALRARGVADGDAVGIGLRRSIELIVATVGVVRAGASYVPLDPDYPIDRLGFLIEDAALTVILTHGAGGLDRTALGDTDTVAWIDLERDADAIAEQSETPPEKVLDPLSIACSIYTSGTTGRPKGVVVPHRGIVRLLLETNYVELGPDSVFAQLSSFNFDAAHYEIWGALLHGARLVILDRDTLLDADRLRAALVEHGITSMFLTTSLFQQYARQHPGCFASVDQVIFGGERCDPDAVREAMADGPAHLIHAYGPTESTTFATCYEIPSVAPGALSIPIGGPIANTRILVVDPNGRLTPPGLFGELVIGGDGLAHGYHGRPALTAEKFVPDPYATTPGQRLYRTGDLVRWTAPGGAEPEGVIDFVGRIDQQIKLRGFRIELGEIETVLGQAEGIAAQVVTVQRDEMGLDRLVAHVVPADSEVRPDLGALREHLAERLPEYMVPAAFGVLDRLPLTPNGKIDRRALPPVEVDLADDLGPGPSNETEAVLAELFAEILGLPTVGVDASFLELGGHSLL
ncbi:MAG: non-ribosomal peptide synthetase, partial [Acidobacteriota bacterium]